MSCMQDCRLKRLKEKNSPMVYHDTVLAFSHFCHCLPKNLLVFKVWNMRSMHTKWRQTWFNWHMQSVCCWIDFYRKLELIRVFSEITIQWQAVIRNNVCRLGRFMSVGSVFHFKDFSLTKANLFNSKLCKLMTFWSDFISYKSLAKTRFFTTWATNPLLNNFGMDF